ncbi:MAG TPA: ABC transporter permease [Candidatus Angelobacter sp.]
MSNADNGSAVTNFLTSLWHDLRYGTRMLRRNPGFSLAAILTLALGIGANTAIFTITSAVLLKPLPYRDPQQLVSLDAQQKDQQSRCCTLGWSDLFRQRSQSFAGSAVFAIDTFNLTGGGDPQQVVAARVSPGFFELLGVKPQLGRPFIDEEGRPEGKFVVLLSDSLWHSRFGGNPQIVGQTVNLDSKLYTIVGVLPPDVPFPFLGPAEIWTPRYFEHSLFTPQRLRQGVGYLNLVARLRPNVSLQQALAEARILHEQYRKENPAAPDADPEVSVVVKNLQDSIVSNFRTQLLFLSLFVALVLLIACANVASLLLSRALARGKEVALRSALGARRSSIVRQLLTESILLSMIAGVIGLGLSYALTRWLVTVIQNSLNLPPRIPITMDARVLGFTIIVSILTGVIFGIFPALQLSRTNMNATLRDEGRGSTGGRSRIQMKNLLVVGQVAVSLVLLISAGLLVRSFSYLLRVDPGFDPTNVLTMNISLPTVKYADAQKQNAFFDEVLRRVSALPGVRSAATSAALPLIPKRITPVLPEGQPEVPLAQRPFIIIEQSSPRLLETLRIPVKLGRAFADADNAQAPKVIIVNETFARSYWPNQNPIGKHVIIGRGPAPSEVVGMAANVKNRGLAVDVQPQIYLPFAQLSWGNMNLLVRTANDPHTMISAVRAQIAAVDADQPVTNVQTVEELMDGSRSQPRFMMSLLAAFSMTALALAVVGIYGALAYSVAQRRSELGIRLALGAEKSDILRLVVRQGVMLTLAGIVIGTGIGLVAAKVFNSQISDLLYKISVFDVPTFVLTPVIFIVIGALASYLPAQSATKVQPTEALRGSN